jgi:hypothetical protein
VLQIAISLSPPVFVNDISQRNTAYWSKPTHGVADRQQCIGVDVRRQSERGLRFFLETQVQVVRVAPRPSARAASSMFCTAG